VAGKRHAAAAVAEHDPQVGRAGVRGVHTSSANVSVSVSVSPRPVRSEASAPADTNHDTRIASR